MGKRIIQIVSWISLAGAIAPSLMYLAGVVDLDQSKRLLMAATIGWFVTAPLWIGRDGQKDREVI
jgi:sensor domain CHASE-containing protein